MPPRPPSSTGRTFDDLLKSAFYCPACSPWRTTTPRLVSATAKRRNHFLRGKRHNSTLVSSTAVNATKKIPAKYQALYQALQDVQKKASAQVNQSRLQLALSSLESERPVTRVAVLGINKSATARKIVRLLLADSLGPEEHWEKQLQADGDTEDSAVLIRYGDPVSPSLQPSRTAIPTVVIPSKLLQEYNLEILISSVFTPSSSAPVDAIGVDTFLTPFAGTPTSASGRQTIVTFPVHKTVILANGLDEFQSLSQMLALTSYGTLNKKRLIHSAVNLDGITNVLDSNTVTVLDVSRVGEALNQIRTSLEYAPAYEVSLTSSGIPKLAKWLSDSSISTEAGLSDTLVHVIESIIEVASTNVQQQIAAAAIEEQAALVDSETREDLEQAIDDFLADAHLELQTGLARAFESPSWRKLAWYKLLWRVDDVPVLITDLTQQYWLKESSLVVFEMLGRLHQAGLIEFISYDGKVIEFATTAEGRRFPPAARPAEAYPMVTDYLEKPDQPSLKSSELTRARRAFLTTTIPTMTATAQSSLAKAIGFSTTALGLSGLAYVSTLAPSLYECGAILALGLVFAMRRMQKQWETGRKQFQQDIFGVGRAALKSTEDFMRSAVRDGGREIVDQGEVQRREEAAVAIDRAKKALDELRK